MHSDARVDNRDHVPVLVATSVHLDVGVGWRERQRVLDQLGDDVTDIGRRRTVDARVVDVTETHSPVPLDLTERAANHIAHRDRRAPRSGRRQAGEHEQRLRVAPHAGREVVEAEEMLERLRIRLVVLELGDELELAGEQVLVAPTEVDVRIGDTAAQGCLLDRERHRAVLHPVERDLDVVDLTTCAHAHRSEPRLDDRLVDWRLQDLLHRRRQSFPGHVGGLVGKCTQRAGDPAVREPQEADREEHRSDGDRHPVALFVLRVRRQAARLRRDDRGGVGLGNPEQVDRVRTDLEQRDEVRSERVAGRGLQVGHGGLAGRRVERSDDRALEGPVGADAQIGVALGLAVGELLRVQDRGGVVRYRGEPDLDANARLRVTLAGKRVQQLGAAAELGVVDRRTRALVGIEQLPDEARVAIEDPARVLRVRRRRALGGVVLGKLAERREAGADLRQRRAVVAGRRATDAAEELAEVTERDVGAGRDLRRELGVLRGDQVLLTDGPQRFVVTLVLERRQRAGRSGGRGRESGLELDLIRPVVGIAHLECCETRQRRERHCQRRRQLRPDRQLAFHQRSFAPRPCCGV